MKKIKSKLETNSKVIKQLEKGENSGFIKNFNRKTFLKKLHEIYLYK